MVVGCPISFGLNHIPDPPVRETTATAPLWGVGFQSQKPSLCRSGKAVVPQPCPPLIPCEHSVHDPETNFFVLEGKNHLWECGPLDRYIITPGKNPSKWWPSLRPKRGGEVRTQKLPRPFQSQAASAPQIRTFVRNPDYRPLSFHSRSTGTNRFQHRIERRAHSGHLDKNGAHGGRGGFPATNQPPHFPQALGPFHCTQELGYCTYSSSSHTLW